MSRSEFTARPGARCTRCAPTSTTGSTRPDHLRPHRREGLDLKGDVVGGKRELSAAAPSADRPRRERPAGTRPSRSGAPGHHGDEHRGRPRRDREARGRAGRRRDPRPPRAPSKNEEASIMLIPRKVKHRKATPPQAAWCRQRWHQSTTFGDYGIRPGARHHQPADRVRAYRHQPPYQAWWQGVDQHLPGPSADQEAGRNPHGLGQGSPVVGRQRQARPGALFELRATPMRRSPRCTDAADHKLPIKARIVTRRGAVLMVGVSAGEAARAGRRGPTAFKTPAGQAKSCSICASSRPPDSWPTIIGCAHRSAGDCTHLHGVA